MEHATHGLHSNAIVSIEGSLVVTQNSYHCQIGGCKMLLVLSEEKRPSTTLLPGVRLISEGAMQLVYQ